MWRVHLWHLPSSSVSVPCSPANVPHISKWVSFTYSLGAFPDYCFFARSWGKTINNPFKRGVCFFIVLLDPLDVSFFGFPSQVFCGFISLVYILRVRSLMWGANLLLVWEKHLSGEIPSCCVLPCHEWVFFGRLCLYFYLFWYGPFIVCCEKQFI